MNDDDSSRILSLMNAAGYKPTTDPAAADLIVVNTCSVRDKAEQKVYSALGRLKRLKRDRPRLIIGVSGCVAQQEGRALLKRVPHLDIVIGTHAIHMLPRLVRKVLAGEGPLCETTLTESLRSEEYSIPTPDEGKVKSFVTIMRGCNNYCSYCIVPFLRGPEVSRPSAELLAEIGTLAEAGVREVTLLGQNVNSYGNSGEDVTFVELLRRVASIDGIERVRFVTSHPRDLSVEIIDLFGAEQKLARSIHLPVQSGSDAVLERMGRGYTVQEYMVKIDRLRAVCPDISITTDIIVGFPGESDEDFERTMELVRTVQFDGIFSFKYSPRPGTRAATFDLTIPADVASARLELLQSVQKAITLEKNRTMVGTTQTVLVEGTSKTTVSELTGRTSTNRVVNMPGDLTLVGKMIPVTLTEAFANSLRGDLAEYAERSPLCS